MDIIAIEYKEVSSEIERLVKIKEKAKEETGSFEFQFKGNSFSKQKDDIVFVSNGEAHNVGEEDVIIIGKEGKFLMVEKKYLV